MPEFVSTGLAAEIMGISESALRRYAQLGIVRVATITPGGHLRFALKEINALRAAMDEKARAYRTPATVKG